jgi:hypothetical protein
MAAAACCAPSFYKHTNERINHRIVAFPLVLIRENTHRIVRCLQQCMSTSRFSQCQQVAGWLFSTTFLISHKLASTMYTDRSVEVEDGRNFIRVALLASKLWCLLTIYYPVPHGESSSNMLQIANSASKSRFRHPKDPRLPASDILIV